MEGGTPRTAFAWDTTTTLSSSSPVVPALVSSAVMIPETALLTKISKAVLRLSPETISTATSSQCDIQAITVYSCYIMDSFPERSLVRIVTSV